ncbi:MAG: hypothetical protein ACOYNL_00655 [Rickettsiales bacterium]
MQDEEKRDDEAAADATKDDAPAVKLAAENNKPVFGPPTLKIAQVEKAENTGIGGLWFASLRMLLSAQMVGAKYWTTMWEKFGSNHKAWQGAADIIVEANREFMTQSAIKNWVHHDARTHTQEDGTSPGGRFYTYVKNNIQMMMEAAPEQVRENTKAQFAAHPEWQEKLRGVIMAKQFGEIDKMIHKAYRLYHPELAQKIRWQGTLCDEQYNHTFLTETSHEGQSNGEIVAVDVDNIVKLFDRNAKPAANGKRFPHIIITSSHAQGETLHDVRSITHGIEALARDSEGRALPHGYVDKEIKPGQTLTLYACDVEETPWQNGAALLKRILELKKIAKTGKPEREFREISPGAKRIAKLMLKCMVEDPSTIDVDSPDSIATLAKKREKPITLREDAVEVAHHFQLIGYSKGGNVVSDAVRYLISELTAKHRVNGKQTDIFQLHEQSPNMNGDGRRMGEHNVRNIVRSIAIMALAAVEVGMSDHDIRHGARRDAFNNEDDQISAHQNYESNPPYDRRWLIKGTREHLGHAPHQMMGSRHPMTPGETIVGYAHDDPRVARRLKEFYATNYGKSAISQVVFGEGAKNGEVIIEAATGTNNRQVMNYAEKIKEEVGRAFNMGKDERLRTLAFTPSKTDYGMFTLTCTGKNFTNNPKALECLKNAFGKLRSEHTQGIVIAQSIVEMNGDIDNQSIIANKARYGGFPPPGSSPAGEPPDSYKEREKLRSGTSRRR